MKWREEEVDQSQSDKRNVKQVWLGIGLTFLLHGFLFIYPPALVLIGLNQFLYLLPILIWAGIKRKKGLFQGILIAAGITFLINAACFGIFFYSFLNY